MRIEHIAIWTADLERMRAFYERHFGATSGGKYVSANQPGMQSYFLTFPTGGARLEIMTAHDVAQADGGRRGGSAHIALSTGSRDAVDALVARLRSNGVRVTSAPRQTGDGYYEAIVADPDGNLVEITA